MHCGQCGNQIQPDDANNCGSCRNRLISSPGNVATCSNSQPLCTNIYTDPLTQVQTRWTYCPGIGCRNLQIDGDNCGVCGNSLTGGDGGVTCKNGAPLCNSTYAGTNPPQPYDYCPDGPGHVKGCRNLITDNNNCTACGVSKNYSDDPDHCGNCQTTLVQEGGGGVMCTNGQPRCNRLGEGYGYCPGLGCKNLNQDVLNCGQCGKELLQDGDGVDCSRGSGNCIAEGFTYCDTVAANGRPAVKGCRNLGNDEQNCGVCGRSINVSKGGGATCINSQPQCTDTDERYCLGVGINPAEIGCVNLQTDNEHCTDCNTNYEDLDPLLHCGGCGDVVYDNGTALGGGEENLTCINGVKGCKEDGFDYCEGEGCVDFLTNDNNCGICFRNYKILERMENCRGCGDSLINSEIMGRTVTCELDENDDGTPVCADEGTYDYCDSTGCVNKLVDDDHCGKCDQHFTTLERSLNCRFCGDVLIQNEETPEVFCDISAEDNGGEPVPTCNDSSLTYCDDFEAGCVSLTDPNHCGGCGNRLIQLSDSNTVSCNAQGQAVCALPGYSYCPGVGCVNKLTDDDHCGNCGVHYTELPNPAKHCGGCNIDTTNQRLVGEYECIDNVATCTANSNLTFCPGAGCFDLTTDAAHCTQCFTPFTSPTLVAIENCRFCGDVLFNNGTTIIDEEGDEVEVLPICINGPDCDTIGFEYCLPQTQGGAEIGCVNFATDDDHCTGCGQSFTNLPTSERENHCRSCGDELFNNGIAPKCRNADGDPVDDGQVGVEGCLDTDYTYCDPRIPGGDLVGCKDLTNDNNHCTACNTSYKSLNAQGRVQNCRNCGDVLYDNQQYTPICEIDENGDGSPFCDDDLEYTYCDPVIDGEGQVGPLIGCVMLQLDDNNCGECGRAYTDASLERDDNCTGCGVSFKEAANREENCRSCGHELVNNGVTPKCIIDPVTGSGEPGCVNDENVYTYCEGVNGNPDPGCKNTLTDVEHCGGCGNFLLQQGGGSLAVSCENGLPKCEGELEYCDGVGCVDKTTNDDHCTACDKLYTTLTAIQRRDNCTSCGDVLIRNNNTINNVPVLPECNGGSGVTCSVNGTSATGFTYCPDDGIGCVNKATDNDNCGACGVSYTDPSFDETRDNNCTGCGISYRYTNRLDNCRNCGDKLITGPGGSVPECRNKYNFPLLVQHEDGVPGCQDTGYTYCEGSLGDNDIGCVNTLTDPFNCGECGKELSQFGGFVPGEGAICENGLPKCIDVVANPSTPGERKTYCAETPSGAPEGCYDTDIDVDNCGGCGNFLIQSDDEAFKATCENGLPKCSVGKTYCPGEGCKNLATDNDFCVSCTTTLQQLTAIQRRDNCSSCGDVLIRNNNTINSVPVLPECNGGNGVTCSVGGNSATAFTYCPDNGIGCVDKSTDPLHCGECGNACNNGFTCELGVCTDPNANGGGVEGGGVGGGE